MPEQLAIMQITNQELVMFVERRQLFVFLFATDAFSIVLDRVFLCLIGFFLLRGSLPLIETDIAGSVFSVGTLKFGTTAPSQSVIGVEKIIGLPDVNLARSATQASQEPSTARVCTGGGRTRRHATCGSAHACYRRLTNSAQRRT